jgi:hypothetical protein
VTIRSSRGLSRHRCPFCGRVVLGDAAASTFHHEAPVCAGFEAKIQEFGLKPIHTGGIRFVDVDAKDLPS